MKCMQKDYRSEEEILFDGADSRPDDGLDTPCEYGHDPESGFKSLVPFPARAERLRTQKYW